jgi:single-strand DNA-binding protein
VAQPVAHKAAEMCEKYLSKGDKIYVEGRIRSRQWQTEDGSKIYIRNSGDRVYLLSTKKGGENNKETCPTASNQ